MSRSNMLKLIQVIIIVWALYSSSKSYSSIKQKINSNSFGENIIEYIHSCEFRIILLLLFIIIQNISLVFLID